MVSESKALQTLSNYNKGNARNPNLIYNGLRIPGAEFHLGSQVWYYSCDDDGDVRIFQARITEGPILCCRVMRILGVERYIWHTYCIKYVDARDARDAMREPREINLIEVPEMCLRELEC
ncbi:uncharacterized protein EAF01_011614 [Botrytis porri]|uniref:uncharacterized protein n=1 Tax=Botrytis porri TaxID=87229 RepID=UPI0019012DF8|nr:uncharacterized protein EAF01_011614 [Botrytis porri]KAF7883105.1 hypothetical protein EAF01_011614 [Botrytis porri]